MARNPIGALLCLVLCIPFLAIAIALLGWMAFSAAVGFDEATHAMVPLLGMEHADFFKMAWSMGGLTIAFGVFALFIGLAFLSNGRIMSLPADVSIDGESRFELSAPPRLGGPLEGVAILGRKAVVGDLYTLILQCRNVAVPRDETVAEYAHRVKTKVSAVPGVNGARLPFRFDIPSSAPPTGADYEWALIAIAPKKWFGSTFIFKVGQ